MKILRTLERKIGWDIRVSLSQQESRVTGVYVVDTRETSFVAMGLRWKASAAICTRGHVAMLVRGPIAHVRGVRRVRCGGCSCYALKLQPRTTNTLRTDKRSVISNDFCPVTSE